MRVIDLENLKCVNIDEKYSRLLKECNKETCYNCQCVRICNAFVKEYNVMPCNIIGHKRYMKPSYFSRLMEFFAGCAIVSSLLVFVLIIVSLVFTLTGIGGIY